MKLSIKERLVLLGSLPETNDIAALRIARKLKESLAFGEEEWEKFSLEYVRQGEGGIYNWSPDYDEYEAEIEIGEKATDIVVQALKMLNNNKKLTENHMSLWDKFVGE